MAAGRGLPDHRSRLRARVLGNAGQSIFVLNRAHPVRARPIRGDERAVRLHTTSGICRRRLDCPGKWNRARFVVRRRVSWRHRLAVPAAPNIHRRPRAAKTATWLCRLCTTSEVAADPRDLVMSGGELHAFVEPHSHKRYYGISDIMARIYGVSASVSPIPSNAGTTWTG